jgi:hypothetical protein
MSLGRNALFGAAVTAALGVPFALSDKEESASPSHEADAHLADAHLPGVAASASETAPHSATHLASAPSLTATGAVEGPLVADLAEILRFDLTPAWITQRWPRVMNSRHAGGELQAYRVPLVASAKVGGLTGALTYYFTEEQKLQGIQFYGNAADAQPLANFLTSQHGLERYKSGDPSLTLYELRRDGKAVSQLLVHTAPWIDASQPEGRYRVEFVLDHPLDNRMFSESATHRFDGRRWP